MSFADFGGDATDPYCGSPAVEARPSKANGAPDAWAQFSRPIGSLEHAKSRSLGGHNYFNLDRTKLFQS